MTQTLLEQYWPLLQAVTKIKNRAAQRTVLRHLRKHKPFVQLLKEISVNTVNQNIKLDARHKRRLNKHSKVIKGLTKSRYVDQAGGFLGIVVPILATVIGELLRKR